MATRIMGLWWTLPSLSTHCLLPKMRFFLKGEWKYREILMVGERSMARSKSIALSLLSLLVTKWWRVLHYAEVLQLHPPPNKSP